VIMTTHDLAVARSYCSKLLFLNRVAVAYGSPSEVFTPEVLQKAYGGHVVRLQTESSAKASKDESLMILLGDTHHELNSPLGDKH